MSSRRAVVRRALLAGAAAHLCSALAFGGSYLNRAALLIAQGGREVDYLRARVNDRELADVVRQVARTRIDAASRMSVPKEVVQAHPHVLLVLENFERAADAAAEGQVERFLTHYQRARDEERTLRGVLKQLGWSLPDH